MKRLHNYILLSVLAFVLASCSEDEVIDINGQGQVAGDISFGLSLPEVSSRTVYGKEAGNAFPIYWVDGDKVQVFSPQGLDGRKSAEYVVSTKDDKGNVVTDLNYASNLTKTGDYGVQWGTGYPVDDTSGYHDFYSLYPSGNYTLSTDGTKAENITINSMQNIVVNGGVVKSDMEDCLMYAKPTGVVKGETVNLQYNPITTALMITVKVAENQTGTDLDNFTIQSIKLEADAEIAGTFSLNVQDGTFGGFVDGKSSKTIQADIVSPSTGGYHTIKNGESFTIPLFLAPTDKTLNVMNWKISVVANNNVYTKTLKIDKTLTTGQIHKIVLPELAPAATDWDITKWMTYIPRNVYLSEVSIPGSWNSLNPEYQGTSPTISSQYSNGVRAFHLDTRWTTTLSAGGALFVDDFYKVSNLKPENMYLSVADGAGGSHVRSGSIALSSSLGQVMKQNNTSFETYLSQIMENVKPDEYLVLFCSFAHESFNDIENTGMTWMQAISNACENLNKSTDTKYAGKIYDASKLSSNTLVGDVLGKVIVIVNCENAIADITLPSNSLCLFVSIPNKLSSDYFPTDGFKTDDLHSSSAVLDIKLAVSQAQITSSKTTSYTHNTRGYYPTFDERTKVVNAILDWSKENYNTINYTHNKWIFLGLGGNTASSSTSDGDSGTTDDVASIYNPLINKRVTEMGTKPEGATAVIPYYPVGIVLMNLVNNNVSTVKNILLLNNKYRLQYDKNQPSDYTPTETTQVVSKANYDSTVENGGNAISWD